MMDVRALPTELLDERDIKGRYRQIDAAVVEAKKKITQSVANKGQKKMDVKLTQPV